jgi:hypothetical protein
VVKSSVMRTAASGARRRGNWIRFWEVYNRRMQGPSYIWVRRRVKVRERVAGLVGLVRGVYGGIWGGGIWSGGKGDLVRERGAGPVFGGREDSRSFRARGQAAMRASDEAASYVNCALRALGTTGLLPDSYFFHPLHVRNRLDPRAVEHCSLKLGRRRVLVRVDIMDNQARSYISKIIAGDEQI